MESHFSAEFFRGNRARLNKLFTGKAPIVIAANGQMQRSADTTYAFRQDSNFWYLTGIDEPDFILVLDKDKEYLIAPKINAIRDVFDGALNKHEVMSRSGIKTVLDNKSGWKQLETRLSRVKHMATFASLPSYDDKYGFYANPARARLIDRAQEVNPKIELLDLKMHLSRMRMVKQPQELKAMQDAIDLTTKALKKVKTKLSSYDYEYQIEAELNRSFRLKGGNGHAFTPIVAGGKNACTIHYLRNNASLENVNFVLIDVGAEVENYAADITRTYARKPPTKREQSVFDAVNDVQIFAMETLRPGITIREYEKLIAQYMGEKLRELGLIKSINSENVRKYFPTMTSHFLGLDAHDSGDYDKVLEPNMVLTVEPGIYIPKEGIGVRIEDDVLITKSNIKILSKNLPRDLV